MYGGPLLLTPTRAWTSIAVWTCISIAVTAAAIWLAAWSGRPLTEMTRDPVAALHGWFFTGFVSQLGAVCWTLGATAALLAGNAVSHMARLSVETSFLRSAAALSILIGVDDLFLFHERIAPTRLGISETLVEVTWAMLALALVLRFRRVVFAPCNRLLVVPALALLGASNALDLFLPMIADRQFYEDIPKFAGVLGWSIFLFAYAQRTLREAICAPASS